MDTYVLVANALIDPHRYFRTEFRKLGPMVLQEQIKIPDGIFRKLRRGTDGLFKAVKRWSQKNPDCIVRITHSHIFANALARIERQYDKQIIIGKKSHRGFCRSLAGKKAADGQVIAVAKVLSAAVVSDDRAIHLACMVENIPCISWTEFARRANLSTQLSLFST